MRRSPGDYQRVLIVDPARRDPVFHRVREHGFTSGHNVFERLIGPACESWKCRERFAGVALPRVHAEAFGRPCRRCYEPR